MLINKNENSSFNYGIDIYDKLVSFLNNYKMITHYEIKKFNLIGGILHYLTAGLI